MSQTAAYTKLVIAFLNSSGFHLATMSLHPMYKNIATAINQRSKNIVSLTKNNIASKNPSALSQAVPAVRTLFDERGMILSFKDVSTA